MEKNESFNQVWIWGNYCSATPERIVCLKEMTQCRGVCCSVLQCVAVCYSMLCCSICKGRARRSGEGESVRLTYVKIPRLNLKLSNLVSQDTTLPHTAKRRHPWKQERKKHCKTLQHTATHRNTKHHALYLPAIKMWTGQTWFFRDPLWARIKER